MLTREEEDEFIAKIGISREQYDKMIETSRRLASLGEGVEDEDDELQG